MILTILKRDLILAKASSDDEFISFASVLLTVYSNVSKISVKLTSVPLTFE